MLRVAVFPLVLALLSLPVQAHDDRTRTALGAGLGAAVGAALGSELGGRNEAILGGAVGGAVGAAIASEGRHDDHRRYRHVRRHDYWDERGYGHRERGHRKPHRCPPGLAKQGRC